MKNKIQPSIDANLRTLDEVRKTNYDNEWNEKYDYLFIEQKQALKSRLKKQHTSAKRNEDIDKKIEIETLIDEAFSAHKEKELS